MVACNEDDVLAFSRAVGSFKYERSCLSDDGEQKAAEQDSDGFHRYDP